MQEKTEPMEPIQPNMELFNAISDETRLKILMILSRSEFTVNELKEILDIHQSNASRHLAKLSSCGLLRDRREGTKAFYGLSDDLYLSHSILAMIRQAWLHLADYEIVLSKVNEKLTERRNSSSPKFHKLEETGGSLKAQIGLFAKLITPFEHAIDIGCGEGGDLSFMLAHRCKKVTAVDINQDTVNGVTALAGERGDLVLMSQVLHHAPAPAAALEEAIRLLKPAGTLALLDLAQHNEEELRETHGHLWLGFDQKRIEFFLQNLPCRITDAEVIPSENKKKKKLPAICFIVRKNA